MSLLFLFVVGISFAYFQTQYGNGGKVDLKAKTYSVDELSFNIGEDITINPNQFNFAQGKGNLEGATNASAILKANNKTHLAKMNYYAYVVVTKNEFKYTTSDKKAELVLSVEGPNGVVTTLPDLGNAIDVTDNEGNTFKAFDITEFSGVITLADNKEIEVTSGDNGKKQEDWKIKVTFINLDADQSNNSDKNFNANMMIQKEKFAGTMADICKGQLLTDCVSAQYYVLKNHNGLYYHDGTITDSNSNVIDAGDNSYRYAGPSDQVNNFVCFGSTESPCPTDNLYRIVGVFGENYHGVSGQQLVKLIKYDYANSNLLGTDGDYQVGNGYTWNYKADTSNYNNTWSTSLLNKINLNTNFISNIGPTLANKIATTTWKVGGNTRDNIADAVPEVVYLNEVVNPSTTALTGETEYSAKIGLMYVSDYAFAASPSVWTLIMSNNNENTINNNWIYMGEEWTISRYADTSGSAYYVQKNGVIDFNAIITQHAVRPSFILESSITYVSGMGSMSDPIIIT